MAESFGYHVVTYPDSCLGKPKCPVLNALENLGSALPDTLEEAREICTDRGLVFVDKSGVSDPELGHLFKRELRVECHAGNMKELKFCGEVVIVQGTI